MPDDSSLHRASSYLFRGDPADLPCQYEPGTALLHKTTPCRPREAAPGLPRLTVPGHARPGDARPSLAQAAEPSRAPSSPAMTAGPYRPGHADACEALPRLP